LVIFTDSHKSFFAKASGVKQKKNENYCDACEVAKLGRSMLRPYKGEKMIRSGAWDS
jgi:hypothetical protein